MFDFNIKLNFTQQDIDRYFIQTQPDDMIFVSHKGHPDNSGSIDFPVKTISDAFKLCNFRINHILYID